MKTQPDQANPEATSGATAHPLDERSMISLPVLREAAVLLCALVPTDPDGTRRLLQRASESPSAWIRSLAVRQSATGSDPSGPRTASACAADPLAHAA